MPLVFALMARASQSAPVTDLEGAWALQCAHAELSVHLGLAGTFAGVPAAIDDTFVLPLDCSLTDAELWDLSLDVYRSCRDAGLDRPSCRQLTHDVRVLARDLSARIAPVEFSLAVSEADAFGVLFGLYPATGIATWSDGTQEAWSYVVDNNDGTRGGYGTLGLGLDVTEETGMGCLAAAVGTAGV